MVVRFRPVGRNVGVSPAPGLIGGDVDRPASTPGTVASAVALKSRMAATVTAGASSRRYGVRGVRLGPVPGRHPSISLRPPGRPDGQPRQIVSVEEPGTLSGR